MNKLYIIFIIQFLLFGCISNNTRYRYTPIKQDYVSEVKERFAKLTPEDSSITHYDSLNNIISIYKKSKINLNIDEFDSSESISKKINEYLDNNPDLNKIYTIFVPDFKDMIRNDIKYNKEKNKFYCHLPNIYGLGNTLRRYFPILISGGDQKASGTYTGSNAFGATAQVKKYSGKAIILAGVNAEEIEEKFSGKKINNLEQYGIKKDPDFIKSMTFTSDVILPDEAREIYKNIGIAIKFKPYPYIIGNKESYLIKNELYYDSPTLSLPYETKMSCTVIFGKIISIYLVNKLDGKVLGGYSFYK